MPWDDDDDWVGEPPEGRYTRDRAKPEFWRENVPVTVTGVGIVIVVIVLALVLLFAAPASADYRFLLQWGSEGKGPGQFLIDDQLAFDPSGHLWIADSGGNRLQRFTPRGEFVSQIPKGRRAVPPGSGGLRLPYSVDIDDYGTMYVTDTYNHRIKVFDARGRLVRQWGKAGGTLEGDAAIGVGPGEFNQPRGISLDPAGNLWVADHKNARMQRFTPTGRLLGVFGANGGDGTPGGAPGEFNWVRGSDSDPSGNVYVADYGNHRIVKLGPGGAFLAAWGRPDLRPGTGNGEFNLPYDVEVAPDGTVWVTDTANHRVQWFTQDGEFLGRIGANGGDGTEGHGPGEFEGPYGVTSDCRGNIYVTDEDNHRVQKFGDPAWGDPPCRPVLTAGRPEGRPLDDRTVTLTASCDKPCRPQATGRVTVPGGKLRIGPARGPLAAGGEQVVLKLRIGDRAARRMREALAKRSSLRLEIAVTAAGPAGRARSARRAVAVER